MLQYSVYARPCPSEDNYQVHEKRVLYGIPPDGEVRILKFTDKQFERMKVFYGKTRKATEEPSDQLSFL